MSINVEMWLRASFGSFQVGRVTEETTIKEILQRAEKIIRNTYPDSIEAQNLTQGKQLKILAYSDILEPKETVSTIMNRYNIKDKSSSFFYRAIVMAL